MRYVRSSFAAIIRQFARLATRFFSVPENLDATVTGHHGDSRSYDQIRPCAAEPPDQRPGDDDSEIRQEIVDAERLGGSEVDVVLSNGGQ